MCPHIACLFDRKQTFDVCQFMAYLSSLHSFACIKLLGVMLFLHMLAIASISMVGMDGG